MAYEILHSCSYNLLIFCWSHLSYYKVQTDVILFDLYTLTVLNTRGMQNDISRWHIFKWRLANLCELVKKFHSFSSPFHHSPVAYHFMWIWETQERYTTAITLTFLLHLVHFNYILSRSLRTRQSTIWKGIQVQLNRINRVSSNISFISYRVVRRGHRESQIVSV